MRSTSERHVRWYGATEASQQLISTTCMNVCSMGRVVAYVCFCSYLLAPLRRPQRRFTPLPLSRRCYNRLRHPVWREYSLTFGAYKEFSKVRLHPVIRWVATCSNTISWQREAFDTHTACSLRIRFVPRSCHARYAPHLSHIFTLTTWIGSFVALYRAILNGLPLLFPANVPLRENLRNLFATLFSTQDEHDDLVLDDSQTSSSSPSPLQPQPLSLHISPGERREARLSSSAQIHQSWVRKKTRRWYSILAGAVAGAVAISFEKRSRQNVIAQQLFVRYVLRSSLATSETYVWPVGCRAHTTPTQRIAVSISLTAMS